METANQKQDHPVVFISYSQESIKHSDRVLALADRLREEGIDCNLDRYEESPPQGWPKWMESEIERSEFVLVVCTHGYKEKWRGESDPGTGKGVWHESVLIPQIHYNGDGRIEIIPVVLDQDDVQYIPLSLQGLTQYVLDSESGYEALYRKLTNQLEIVKPQLGTIRSLPSRTPQRDLIAPWQNAAERADFVSAQSTPGANSSQSEDASNLRFTLSQAEINRIISEALDAHQRADYAASIASYRTVLAAKENELGTDHVEIADLLNLLANVFYESGDYREAELGYQRALAIRELALGLDAYETIASVNNIGSLYQRTGQLERAKLYLVRAERAMSARRSQTNIDKHLQIAIYQNLAMLGRDEGTYQQSEIYYNRAEEVARFMFANEDTKHSANALSTTLDNFATLLIVLHRTEEALKKAREGLGIRRATFGEDHPNVALSLNHVGVLLRDTGDSEGAIQHLEEALDINIARKSMLHSDTITVIINILQAVRRYKLYGLIDGLFDKTANEYERYSTIRTDQLDSELVICRSSDENETERRQRRTAFIHAVALVTSRHALGNEHQDTAKAISELGTALQGLAPPDHIITLELEALDIRRKTLPEGHPSIAHSFHSLAVTFSNYGDLVEAENFLKQGIQMLTQHHGKDFPELCHFYIAYANLYRQTDHPEEAAKYEALATRLFTRYNIPPTT
jgi:tetratricopeptide (TPR) repeat protein